MGKMSEYHIEFDKIMKQVFKDEIELVNYFGPVQMCVLGMEYYYTPKKYKIILDCERGGFVIYLKNAEGKSWHPKEEYLHYISSDDDIIHFVKLIYEAIENNEEEFE